MRLARLEVDVRDDDSVEATWTSPCGSRHLARWRGADPTEATALRHTLERTGAPFRPHAFERLLERSPVRPLVVVTHGPRCDHCPASACPVPS